MLHAGLDVVRNDGFGNAAQEFQGVHVGANPAGQLLALGSFGERVVAGAENGDEQRSLVDDLTGLSVMNRNLVAGVVDKHLFARAMIVPQDHIQRARPVVVQLAEPADMCCNTCQPLCGGRIYVARSFESHDSARHR